MTAGSFGRHQFNLTEVVIKLLSGWITPSGEPMGQEKAQEIVSAWLQGERAIGVMEHARILSEMAQETGHHDFEVSAYLAGNAAEIMMAENPMLVIHKIDPKAN